MPIGPTSFDRVVGHEHDQSYPSYFFSEPAKFDAFFRARFVVFAAICLFLTSCSSGCASASDKLYHLTLSPDGKEIAFVLENGFTEIATIFAVDIENQTARRISPPDVVCYQPTYSQDGKQIAYEGDPYEPYFGGDDFNRTPTEGRIYYAESDGSNPRAVTELYPPDDNPLFSPDGSKVYFQRPTLQVSGAALWFDHQLHVIDLESLEIRRLADKKFDYFNSMVLSPDGDEIFVCKNDWGSKRHPPPIPRKMIWRFDLRGGKDFEEIELRWARDSAGREPTYRIDEFGVVDLNLIPGQRALIGAAWIYQDMDSRDSSLELLRFDLETGEIALITDRQLEDGFRYPNFTPDGESILCTLRNEIVRLDKEGANPRLVLTNPELRRSLGLPPKPDVETFFRSQEPTTLMGKVKWFFTH